MVDRLNMIPNRGKGCLITFCGLDGSGKTTMIKKLTQYFGIIGTECVVTKQPTENVRKSEIFRNFMDSDNHSGYSYLSLSLLAASDRVQHTNCLIRPLLEQGVTVISDRYFYSCLANLHARGRENDQWIYEVSQSIIKPDYAFFMDVPVQLAVSRVRSRKEEKNRYIDIDLQNRLREQYLEIARANHGIIIPGCIDENDAFNRVINELKRCEKYEF